MRPGTAVLGAIAAAIALVPAGAAGSARDAQVTQPLRLFADAASRGWVRVRVTGQPGTTVQVSEQTDGGLEPVARLRLRRRGAARGHATPWRCDRPMRHLIATAPAADGTAQTAAADVATPSCARRLRLVVTSGSHRVGRRGTLEIRDRWRLGGIAASVCVAAPRRRSACRAVRVRRGHRRARLRLRLTRRGRWTVTLTTPFGERTRRTIVVRRSGPVRVLATGDSMIQIIDGLLANRLERRGARVRSDAHISTGISKPFMLDWPAHARGSARKLHPDATVVFLGANDGFPMKAPSGASAPCCGRAWIAEYARRARRMMSSYRRRGSGRVYWLLLPAPSKPTFARVFRAVNAALRRAARHFSDGVRLIDVGRVVAPGGRFHQRITYHGRSYSVRQGDGVHLSVAGASIAAALIVRAMRADGLP